MHSSLSLNQSKQTSWQLRGEIIVGRINRVSAEGSGAWKEATDKLGRQEGITFRLMIYLWSVMGCEVVCQGKITDVRNGPFGTGKTWLTTNLSVVRC